MKVRLLVTYIAIGAVVGGIMIFTHQGPGIIAHKGTLSSPQSRNDTRLALLKQLAAALTQYQKDHGNLPLTLPATATQICAGAGSSCAQYHLADLSFLTTEGDYVPTIPEDPLGGEGNRGSGFFLEKLSNGSLKLTAPKAEAGKTVSLTFTP